MGDEFVMPNDAHALQPLRFVGADGAKQYTAVTFPRNPKGGCQMYYNRCRVAGGITGHDSDGVAGLCDILDKEGDIIADFSLNKKGLNYLYKALGLRVL